MAEELNCQPNPSQGVEYQLTDQDKGLGMVELGPDGVVGRDMEDEELPPGRQSRRE